MEVIKNLIMLVIKDYANLITRKTNIEDLDYLNYSLALVLKQDLIGNNDIGYILSYL